MLCTKPPALQLDCPTGHGPGAHGGAAEGLSWSMCQGAFYYNNNILKGWNRESEHSVSVKVDMKRLCLISEPVACN